MSKPSIIFVPGSFALPEFYDAVVHAVAAQGYAIHALHYPSVGLKTGPREGAPPTMYDDAAFIAKETERLVDEGQDVVLIAHSYGGVPTTESVKGLGKQERRKQGKEGGIVRLAYMTALVPAVGTSAAGVLADFPKEQQLDLKIDEKGWMYHDPISASAAIVFSDISKEEGETWMAKFPQHSAASFGGELTYAGYKDVPVSYLFCEEDLCIPPKNQREGIQLMERESGRKVDVTNIKAGHCPAQTQPQMVVDWILDVLVKAEGERGD